MQAKYQVALAVACALGAPAAFAQISVVNPPAAADVLPIAGASETEPLLISALLSVGGMCQDFDTVTGPNEEANVFTTEASYGIIDGASGPGTLYANFAVVCAASTASGLNPGNASPGKTFAVVKYGGSSASAFALGANLAVNNDNAGDAHWVNITPTGCTDGPISYGGPPYIHYRVWTGCGNQGSVVPKVGITDVEGSFFVTAGATIPAAPSGSTNTQRLTNAILANTTQYSFGAISPGLGWVDVPFAPIVSIPFYKALQAAQLTAAQVSACRGDNTNTGDTNFPLIALQTESCLPSLSTTDIVGLLMQTGGGVAPFLSTTAFPNLTPPADPGIYVCERSPTSGTQAAFNAYYLGFGCAQGVPKIVAATAPPDGTDEFTNTAANRCGTAGVGNCGAVGNVNDYYWGNLTPAGVRLCVADRTADGDPIAATGPGDQWAVGVVSLEQIPDDTFNGQFRYVKVDGITPNLENVVRGSWRFYETNFLQVPTAASGNTLTADQTTLYQSLSNVAQGVTAASTSEVKQEYGLQGYLLQPGGPGALVPQQGGVTTTNVLANPVNSSVKGAGLATATNNCMAPNQVYKEDALATQ